MVYVAVDDDGLICTFYDRLTDAERDFISISTDPTAPLAIENPERTSMTKEIIIRTWLMYLWWG